MRKSKAMPILFFLVFLVGLSLLLYPMFADRWNQRRMDGVIENYVQTAEAVDSAQADQWLQRAREYNQTLEGKGVPDAFAETTPEEDSDYLSQLSFSEDGVMGYLEIPAISVSLPIYHGTGTESLSKGAGHLQGSALPVGGKSTHCVISAHRGLPSAAMFTDLDQLKEGDHFYLSVLDQTLCYEVDDIRVVEPEETDSLNVVPGEDLVTLVTCTPYGINTQRLLVRGHRVDYVPETAVSEAQDPARSVYTHYGLWIAAGLGITALFILLLWLWMRRSMRKDNDPGECP